MDESAHLADYWSVYPPVHLAVRALLGIADESESNAPQATPDAAAEFIQRFKSLGG